MALIDLRLFAVYISISDFAASVGDARDWYTLRYGGDIEDCIYSDTEIIEEYYRQQSGKYYVRYDEGADSIMVLKWEEK